MKTFKQFLQEAKKDTNRTSATAWVILHTENKIILGKRAPSVRNPNQWNFFGGHVDKGESPQKAAARELFEETSYKLDVSTLKQISVIGEAHYFSARINNPSAVKTTDEISKVSNYKLTDLPDNLHSKTQNFFDRLENLLQ